MRSNTCGVTDRGGRALPITGLDKLVIAGLDPASHAVVSRRLKHVDARLKAGHDDLGDRAISSGKRPPSAFVTSVSPW